MRLNKFFIFFLIFSVLYISNLNPTVADSYKNIYLISFNIQTFINQLKNKTKNLFFSDNDDEYKEKYYKLLKNLAQLKLAEQENLFYQSLELLKKRFPKAIEVKVFSNDLGLIYTQINEEINTSNAFAIDKNWLLIGKVIEKKDNYLKIASLNYAGFQFNVSDNSGNFLGLAKSTGLGYLVVDKIDNKIKIEKGDLVLTAGNDNIFPAGFLVGEVVNVEIKGYFKKVQIEPLANFNSEQLIIVQ